MRDTEPDPADVLEVQELANKLIEKISLLLNEETESKDGVLAKYYTTRPHLAATAIATASVVLAAMSLKAIGNNATDALRSVGVLFLRVWQLAPVRRAPIDPKDLN